MNVYCPECNGQGVTFVPVNPPGRRPAWRREECWMCDGSGSVDDDEATWTITLPGAEGQPSIVRIAT